MFNYIHQHLNKKNSAIYFKNGRWIFHLLYWVFVFVFEQKSLNESPFSLQGFLFNFLWDNFFIAIFYFTFFLVLIPKFFKNEKYALFFLYLFLLLIFLPIIDAVFQHQFQHLIPIQYQDSIYNTLNWNDCFKVQYRSYLFNFTSFSLFLFIMETTESLSNYKLQLQMLDEKQVAEKNLMKTKMNPAFLMHSLDSIISLSKKNNTKTPQTIIHFSDLLRFRLYRGTENFVSLNEEILQLQNLFSMHQNISYEANNYLLEVVGDANNKYIAPLSIVNIVEPLMNKDADDTDYSIHLYLLIEEKELQIAIELCSSNEQVHSKILAIHKNINKMFGANTIFVVDKSKHNYSISICLPLQPKHFIA